MSWNDNIDKKIKELFKKEKKLKEKLLEKNAEAIREIGTYSDIGFTNQEIIQAYEKGKIDELYKIAKSKNEIRVLYYDLIGEEPPKELIKCLKNK